MTAFPVDGQRSCENHGDCVVNASRVIVTFVQNLILDFFGQDFRKEFLFHVVVFEPVLVEIIDDDWDKTSFTDKLVEWMCITAKK